MGTFDLHALILCVSEGYVCELICIYIVGMGTSDLHELVLCVFEGYFSELLCVRNVDIETGFLHGVSFHDVFQKNPL